MNVLSNLHIFNKHITLNKYICGFIPPHIYNSHKNMFDLSNTYFTLKEVKFLKKLAIILLFIIADYENNNQTHS